MSESEKGDSMNRVSDGFTTYTIIFISCKSKTVCLKREYKYDLIPKIGWTIYHDDDLDVELDVERIAMYLHNKRIDICLSPISIENHVFDAEVAYWNNLGYELD